MADGDAGTCVLRTQGLRKEYGRETSLVRAVDGVDLDVERGETGRDGARRWPSWDRAAAASPRCCTCSAAWTTAGEIWLNGQDITQMSERSLARLRRDDVGFVFQALRHQRQPGLDDRAGGLSGPTRYSPSSFHAAAPV